MIKEVITYRLVFGIEGQANLQVEVGEDITVRIHYAGAQSLSTFPDKDMSIEWLKGFQAAYSKAYPLLSGIDDIVEKLGGPKQKAPARVRAA